MSLESEDVVKCHPKYEKFHNVKDPKDLWIAIKDLHQVTTASKVDSVVKKAARDDYYRCKQGELEVISSYKEWFSARLEVYIAHGNLSMDEGDIAMDFLQGLSPAKFGDLIAEIINDIAKNPTKKPKDLNTVYNLAVTRVKYVSGKGTTTQIGSSFTTTDQSHQKPKRDHDDGKNEKG